MKTIKIAALKANLSRVLKSVQGGEKVTVFDRNRAVAQITAVDRSGEGTLFERLAREGKCRLATEKWSSLEFTKVRSRADFAEILRWTRRDAGEE